MTTEELRGRALRYYGVRDTDPMDCGLRQSAEELVIEFAQVASEEAEWWAYLGWPEGDYPEPAKKRIAALAKQSGRSGT